MSANKKLSPSCLCARFLCFLSLGFPLFPVLTQADSFDDGVRALARKVSSAAKGTTVTLEMENVSDLKEERVSELHSSFVDELKSQGLNVSAKNVGVKVHLVFSKNASEYIGIARLDRNGSLETYLQPLGQAVPGFALQGGEGLTLRRELVFSSDRPILDLVSSDKDQNRIEVLEPRQITSYDRNGDQWIRAGSVTLPRNRPTERNPKGRFFREPEVSSAVFPEEVCKLPGHDGDRCRSRDEETISPRSSAQLGGVKTPPPWITSVQFPNEGQKIMLVAGEGGKIRIYGEDSKPLSTLPGFGDQLSTIQTACASGWITLVTLEGDLTKADSVLGIEIRNLKSTAVTQAMPFDGPVLVLHEDSVASAVAIQFNLQTGLYEAYRLTVHCTD